MKKYICTKKLAILGMLFGAVLLSHPAHSQAQIPEELANMMADDAWEVYKYGYDSGACDPAKSGLQPESRLYMLLQLYFAYCDAGAADRKTGKARSEADIRYTVLETIKQQDK